MLEEQGIIMVVVDLQNPKEKYWGALLNLTSAGIWLKGLNLASFEDWVRQFSPDEYPVDRIGLSTAFSPMHRVERITRDESIGEIASYSEILERRAGSDAWRQIFEADRAPDLRLGRLGDGT